MEMQIGPESIHKLCASICCIEVEAKGKFLLSECLMLNLINESVWIFGGCHFSKSVYVASV